VVPAFKEKICLSPDFPVPYSQQIVISVLAFPWRAAKNLSSHLCFLGQAVVFFPDLENKLIE